jgi:predicted nucleotidyltransferase
MNELAQIEEKVKPFLPELKKEYRIKMLGSFGSYSRGENRQGSDLDMLVEFSVAPDFFQFIKLENYLSGLLGVKVDLVTRSALKPLIRDQILRETKYL